MMNELTADDLAFLTDKYRKDSADSQTGQSNEDLGQELLRRDAADWSALPRPVAKAKAFSYLCENMRIGVSPHDYFPIFGCWNRNDRPARHLLGKWSRQVSSRLHYNDLWNDLNRNGTIALWIDFDHSVPDWDALFSLGFPGILRRVRDCHRTYLASARQTADGRDYFLGVESTWESVDCLLGRFETYARSHVAGSPRIAAELSSLERLRKGVPENTLDALMLMVLYFFMGEHLDHMQVRSLGNLDVRLHPYIQRDLQQGTFSESQIREMLDCFLMQWGSIANYWGQPVYFGGTAADGTSLYNSSSIMILEEYGKLDIISPKLQLKLADNTPDEVLNVVCDLARRSRQVVFVCETGMREGLHRLGFSDEQARRCLISGCYEYAPLGSVQTAVGYVNLLKPLEQLEENQVPTFADFFESYWNKLKETIEAVFRIVDDFESHLSDINPSQVFSGTVLHSLETAKDAFANGSEYNLTSLLTSGFASAVDALAAVRRFVYDRKDITLSAWNDILRQNWAGAEAFRKRVLNSPCRYGNHQADADDIAAKLADRLDKLVNGRPNARGGMWEASSHPARQFIELGKKTAATPDGRLSGEEMSKNISPAVGADRKGVTALMESATQAVKASNFPGDSCLDLMVLPATLAGDEGLAVMKQILRYYLRHNGHAIQFNIFDPDMLCEAQRHPEKYGSLMVRVCGWNTRFNDMVRQEQDAYIERARHLAE